MRYATLLEAAKNGQHVETATHLFGGRGDVRAKFDLGNGRWTTLLHLVAFQQQQEVAALLIASGADVNDPDSDGMTSLYMPVVKGYTGMVKFLLENGANPNTRELRRGDTPLDAAALNGNQKVAELLLAHGADASARNSLGIPPLLVAVHNGHSEVGRLIAQHLAA